MKRIFLIIILCFVLAGCSKQSEELNNQILKVESKNINLQPVITHINNYDNYESFISQYDNNEMKKYKKNYFKENSIIYVLFDDMNSNATFTTDNIEVLDELITINIKKNIDANNESTSINSWLAIIEVNKVDITDNIVVNII